MLGVEMFTKRGSVLQISRIAKADYHGEYLSLFSKWDKSEITSFKVGEYIPAHAEFLHAFKEDPQVAPKDPYGVMPTYEGTEPIFFFRVPLPRPRGLFVLDGLIETQLLKNLIPEVVKRWANTGGAEFIETQTAKIIQKVFLSQEEGEWYYSYRQVIIVLDLKEEKVFVTIKDKHL